MFCTVNLPSSSSPFRKKSLWAAQIYLLEGGGSYINFLKFYSVLSILVLFLLPHLLICVIIYLYQYGPTDIYFIPWILIQYYIIYFVSQIVPALVIQSTFIWGLCPFDIFPSVSFLSTFLLSGLNIKVRFSHIIKSRKAEQTPSLRR